ncbi:MAG: 3-hydroxybutyryl-CoA dehydratase [Rhodobacteraceae bacterium]|nr:MAG: 3-hydroxybutyryl-CoA dehydratase [Paracoccaceae bacterium]
MIDATLKNGVGRITLNNPKVHNSLTREAMGDIRAALEKWAASDIRVLVLTGTGKSFCSGVSLGDVGSGDWSNNPLTALCDAVENFHTPTICGLNGGVYGGGVELALSCDFRIGVTGMKMFVPAAKIGVHYDAAGIARYVQKLGPQTARRVFLLAERFEGQALLDIGFLDFLVEPDSLNEHVEALADTIDSAAPLAVQGMKRTILEISRGTLDADAATQRVAQCFASEDHHEGLAALSEKRAPVFKGR